MDQIGKYEIVRRTGQTPLGTMYEAFDPIMRRTVSIQAPQDESATREPRRRQTSQLALQKGGESLGRLHHPNIRNIIATEESDGALYLIMEHVHARPVSERVPLDGLPAAEVLRLLKMAALALDHAHSQNVLHPGLTPAHLLLDDAGLLKVAGFEMSGLQAMSGEAMSTAEIDELLQSAPYRAPEFLVGEPADAHADQFSLAVIAFELFSGRAAFSYESPITAMSRILSGDGPDLALLAVRLPSVARRVFEKALASDPSARYVSCAALVDALEAALVRKAALPTRVTDSPYVPTPAEAPKLSPPSFGPLSEQLTEVTQKHSRKMQGLLLAACLVAGLVVALVFWQSRSGAPARTSSIPSAAVTPQPKPNPPPTAAAPAVKQAAPEPNTGDIAKKVASDLKLPVKKTKKPPKIDLPEPTVSQ